jgi:enterochelin esterase-like enzyme
VNTGQVESPFVRIGVVAASLIAAFVAVVPLASSARPPAGPLPAGWTLAQRDSAGGTIWTGLLPNGYVRSSRPSAIYLPAGYTPDRRYPVLYLLHGLAGSPASYTRGLDLLQVVDELLSVDQVQPMLIVIPAGADSNSAEWAGPWESYVIRDVLPWTDQHLPTIRTAAGRVLGGLCAGGFGALDIGLRHPHLFTALEAWDGYFAPVFHDGPFRHAPASYLQAHNPTLLVQHDAARLRHDHVSFFLAVGDNHGAVLRTWTLEFAWLLDQLHLPNQLWPLPRADTGHIWAATLPSALEFAAQSFGPAAA